jgi:small-conductance mechanosensitive channel
MGADLPHALIAGSIPGVLVRATLSALVFACFTPSSLAAEAAPTAGPRAAAAPPAAEAPSTLYDVVVDLGREDALRRRIAAMLRDTAGWKSLSDRLDDPALASELNSLEHGRDTLSRARYMELVDADTRIRERVRALNEATEALGKLTRTVEGELERLDRAVARGPERARLGREREAPEEIQRRVETAGADLAAMRDIVRKRRDELLVAFERGTEMQARLDTVRTSIAERRERISTDLRTLEETPIWSIGAMHFPREEAMAASRFARLELADYLREHGVHLGILLGVLTGGVFFALRQSSRGAARRSAGFALVGALLAGLVGIGLLAPRGPFIFYRLIAFFLPLLAGIVATRTFAAAVPATAWTLLSAVFVNEFRLFAEMSPGFTQLLLGLQLLPFAAALVHDWRGGNFARFLPRWPSLVLRRLVQTVLVMLAVAVGAGALGYTSLARTIAALFVIAPGFGLLVAALAWSLDESVAGLLATPLMRTMRSVRERADAIRRAAHGVIVLFCWATGIAVFTLVHSAFDDLLRLAGYIASASVSAGDVTITFSAILSALSVVVVTWLVTKLVRFLLDHEVLPRLNLRTGVPIAISTIVGYVLVVTGFVLTMAALGIDLTKVTLLAGALGIGVGLGLQSVIHNFASGLILMLERPINVGDQIDVGGVVGEVRRIGVRSSTIRTGQGAEVIVPNSDLASKQVINWTLSDRARRYEIDVGVAYGSDPAQVLRLLEGAAAAVPEVQQNPPPRALFTGFGDSSLDFRLFAWVASVDVGLQAQNGLRMAVLRLFREAGIDIPFPQRDLHIRYAAGGLDPLAAVDPVR